MPSRYRDLVLLKLTMLKMTRFEMNNKNNLKKFFKWSFQLTDFKSLDLLRDLANLSSITGIASLFCAQDIGIYLVLLSAPFQTFNLTKFWYQAILIIIIIITCYLSTPFLIANNLQRCEPCHLYELLHTHPIWHDLIHTLLGGRKANIYWGVQNLLRSSIISNCWLVSY